VFAYISSALSNAVATPRTNRFQGQNGTPTSTPSKKRGVDDTTTATPVRSSTRTIKAAQQSRQKKQGDEESTELPPWTMPTIRALCKALDEPKAAPHVFVGVSTVARLLRENAKEDEEDEQPHTPSRKRPRRSNGIQSRREQKYSALPFGSKLPALIAVITFYTLSELSDEAPDGDFYKSQRDIAIKTLREHVPSDIIAWDDEITDADPEAELIADIEKFMREASKAGWLDMEWFRNILPSEGRAAMNADGEEIVVGDEDEVNGHQDEIEYGVESNRGFGTMMTAATDWLSEDRRRDYVVWKKGILKRMDEVERQRQQG
jgi:origin recognition complex subunit 6